MALPFILPMNTPFKAYKGANFSKSLRWVVKAADVITPVVLTGYVFRAQIRERYISDVSVIDLTSESGGFTIDDAANGEFSMNITLEQLALIDVPLRQDKITDIPYKDFVFDIEAIPTGEDPIQFLKGVLRIYAEVTRDDL